MTVLYDCTRNIDELIEYNNSINKQPRPVPVKLMLEVIEYTFGIIYREQSDHSNLRDLYRQAMQELRERG